MPFCIKLVHLTVIVKCCQRVVRKHGKYTSNEVSNLCFEYDLEWAREVGLTRRQVVNTAFVYF